jgi:hypothetical protein
MDYNIRNGGFMHGWDTIVRETRDRKRSRPSKCTECRIQSLCGMCPANGELEQDDPESPVDFLCQVAHLRAMALGEEIPAHGECECCRGGSSFAELEQCVRELPVIMEQLPIPRQNLLTVLNAPASDCGGRCGH